MKDADTCLRALRRCGSNALARSAAERLWQFCAADALLVGPDVVKLPLFLAELEAAEGKPDAQKSILSEAFNKIEGFPEAWLDSIWSIAMALTTAYEDAGEHRRAIQIYERVEALSANRPEFKHINYKARQFRGYALHEVGDKAWMDVMRAIWGDASTANEAEPIGSSISAMLFIAVTEGKNDPAFQVRTLGEILKRHETSDYLHVLGLLLRTRRYLADALAELGDTEQVDHTFKSVSILDDYSGHEFYELEAAKIRAAHAQNQEKTQSADQGVALLRGHLNRFAGSSGCIAAGAVTCEAAIGMLNRAARYPEAVEFFEAVKAGIPIDDMKGSKEEACGELWCTLADGHLKAGKIARLKQDATCKTLFQTALDFARLAVDVSPEKYMNHCNAAYLLFLTGAPPAQWEPHLQTAMRLDVQETLAAVKVDDEQYQSELDRMYVTRAQNLAIADDADAA
jgi:tetratricopeptide (TPR) repeat protein